MIDCHKKMESFCNQYVSLSNKQRREMRERRDANRDRLARRLNAREDPEVKEHISQGSYAMHTMFQEENNEYDIDDGAVFSVDDLVTNNGTYLSALNARRMVMDALNDGSFVTPPELKKNCIRVHYQKGYHVDVPVYREWSDGSLDLASSEWKSSCPEEITKWYNDAVVRWSPDTANGRQMRRITRLLKFFSKSRKSWRNRMPSGLILSVLVEECYLPILDRDDESLYKTLNKMRNRLHYDLAVRHPVRYELLTKGYQDSSVKFLLEKLNQKIDELSVLDDNDCTEEDALEAWYKFFNHDYWQNELEELQNKKSIADRLRGGNSTLGVGLGLGATFGNSVYASPVKTTKAYGGLPRIGKRYGGPWYEDFRKRKIFQGDVDTRSFDLSFVPVRKGKNRHAEYQASIEVDGYESRQVRIIFRQHGNKDFPVVIADGPTESPHRYSDNRLCLWYPFDPKTNRWVFSDGLLHLLSIIQAHLFREAWWREYGEWLGPEKAHQGRK